MSETIEILKKEYWSKSKAFLLPLTGLSRTQRFDINSYLFWDHYSIYDYKLVLDFKYGDNIKEFINYCRKVVFPTLDKNGYLVEIFDYEGGTIMVLDMSKWAVDIEFFLKGKYSRLSQDAKSMIKSYHTYYSDKVYKISIDIQGTLEPRNRYPILNNMTPIEYAADAYGLPLDELDKLGEISSIYHKESETLIKIAEKISAIH